MKKTRNSLYPDILFHFTSKEGLFNILNTTFKVSYAREKILGKNCKREFAVPMVSFCDLKITQLKDHMENYGKYGIGLTKEWANKQGLNPVMYVSRYCDLVSNLMSAHVGIYKHIEKIDDFKNLNKISESYTKFLSIYQYIKNYEGHLIRRGKLKDRNYRFADEREWRYVPNINERGVLPFVPISEIDTPEKKEKYNQRIERLRLNFQPEDIKYLIIERDDEISELIHHLRIAKVHFSQRIQDRLQSRILTAEQIMRDV